MERSIWIDGHIVQEDDARIPATTRGVLSGEGFFETMPAIRGTVHLLHRHLDRLARSCGSLGVSFERPAALAGIRSLLDVSDSGTCVLRLTVLAGIAGNATMIITTRPHPAASDRGLHLAILGTPHAGTGHKSTSCLPYVLASRELAGTGADEGIILTRGGDVAEATISNVFLHNGSELLTPPPELGIVPGIARGRVIELAWSMGISTNETVFGPSDILVAAEVFVTNAVRGVRAATSVNGSALTQGPLAAELRRRYLQEWPDEAL